MAKFLFRRFLFLPVVLVLIHALGFAFAFGVAQVQQSQTIFGSGQDVFEPVWPVYGNYLAQAARLDLGTMPAGASEPLGDALLKASGASAGLFSLALIVSVVVGLGVGLGAVKLAPVRVAPWLTALSTLGLALPGFIVGTLLVGGLLFSVQGRDADPWLPVAGFGWDIHLVLPVLALALRPAMQIAQTSAVLLAGELDKRYVVTARSIGHTWGVIRREKALRNVLAPIFLAMAGSFRWMAAELLLVEWLFNWPGVGRLFVQALVPPRISNTGGLADTSAFFLNPPLVAALLVLFALAFYGVDTLALALARAVDPRLRIAEEEVFRG